MRQSGCSWTRGEIWRASPFWHFAFNAIPELPERLVSPHIRSCFDYSYDVLAATRQGVPASSREAYVRAYSRPEALRTGFNWYRAFEQDERDNANMRTVQTPVLYLRGQEEQGALARYVRGLRSVGLGNVSGKLIAKSGHFTPDERSGDVAEAVAEFMGIC